jgi:anti-sigma B factor antagonist
VTVKDAEYTPKDDDGRLRCISVVERGVSVLSICGDVDFAVRSDFETEIDKAIAGRHSPLVIDLNGVRYIDSSGFVGLIRAQKQMTERDDKLYLVVGNTNVRRLFSILSLDQVFALHETRESALTAASQNR